MGAIGVGKRAKIGLNLGDFGEKRHKGGKLGAVWDQFGGFASKGAEMGEIWGIWMHLRRIWGEFGGFGGILDKNEAEIGANLGDLGQNLG